MISKVHSLLQTNTCSATSDAWAAALSSVHLCTWVCARSEEKFNAFSGFREEDFDDKVQGEPRTTV